MVALHNPLKLKRFRKSHSLAIPTKPCLPNHIFYEVARHSTSREIACLALCSRHLRALLNPLLYSRVELKTNKHCKTTLPALSKNIPLAQLVRTLVVHVNNPEWTDPGDETDEDIIASIISQITSLGGFKSLLSFQWDGLEMPHDILWSSFLKFSPNLKRIRTTIGEDPLNPSCPLWEFNDLREFALTVKCNSLEWLANGLPKPEKLPRKLWAMLLERSPRLEDLTLGSPAPSPRIFDIRHVTAGRWPRLRSITLGDMVLISAEKGDELEANKAFHTFFHFHQELKHVGIEHAAGSAFFPGAFDFGLIEVSPESVDVLPNLESFSGSLKYVKTLPYKTRKQLRSLKITSIHHTVAAIAPTITVLRDLSALEELSAWVDLSFGSPSLTGSSRRSSLDGIGNGKNDDDEKVLRTILDACPASLRHFEIACFNRPGFSIKEFSYWLTSAPPSLTSFTLTKLHRSGDEDLTRGAARMVVENPGLKNFTLRMTHGSWFSAAGGYGRIKSLGVYEVISSPAPALPVEDESVADEFGRVLPGTMPDSPMDSITSSPTSQLGFSCNTMSDGEVGPTAPIPFTLIAHECGQKGISLTGKECPPRHVVYRLTEKEMESCRLQLKDLIRRKMTLDAVMSSASTIAKSSVSRRSSLASSSSQGYGWTGQLAPSGSSFSGFGSRLEPLSFGGNLPLRRNRHRHSSSMSSVPQAGDGFHHRLGYNRPFSITWADQSAKMSRRVGRFNESRGDEVMTDINDYVFV